MDSIFYGKDKNIIGYNYPPLKTTSLPTHAEVCLIDRLPTLIDRIRNKKLKKIDIIPIRTNLQLELRCAKPCRECLHYMNTRARKKGYNINKIKYSTDDGTFINSKLKDLLNEKEKHVSRGQRERLKKVL